MSVLKSSDVAKPVIPQETVPVEALGGDVIVRSIGFVERLNLASADIPKYGHIARMLSHCIVGSDGKPIFTPEEWETFGSYNADALFGLFEVAQRVSGMGEAQKKEPAPS